MYAQMEKPKENKSRAIANSVAQKKSSEKQGFGFVDNRNGHSFTDNRIEPTYQLKKKSRKQKAKEYHAWLIQEEKERDRKATEKRTKRAELSVRKNNLKQEVIRNKKKSFEVLNNQEYKALNYTASHIIKKYPPDKTLYIEMGRSPVPIVEEMKRINNGIKVFTLPMGGIVKSNSDEAKKNHEYMSKVFESMPGKKRAKGKTLLLIDYVSSGNSMLTTYEIMKERYSDSEIKIYEIAKSYKSASLDKSYKSLRDNPNIVDGMYEKGPNNTSHKLTGMSSLISKLSSTEFKQQKLTRIEYAKYGEEGENDLKPTPNPEGLSHLRSTLNDNEGNPTSARLYKDHYKSP